jgi:hypothetical protein
MIGEKFGRLTVIAEAPSVQGRRAWLCKCSCPEGAEGIRRETNLRSGSTKSYGCLTRDLYAASLQEVRVDLMQPGDVFNHLTVIRKVDGRIHGGTAYECECACTPGKRVVVAGKGVRAGVVKSCGCLRVGAQKRGRQTRLENLQYAAFLSQLDVELEPTNTVQLQC